MTEKKRYTILKKYTDNESVITELLAYTENKFSSRKPDPQDFFNLEDEAYISTWKKYCEEAKILGVFETLQSYLVQFQFPVKKGISATNEYRDASLKGKSTENMELATGLELKQPDSLELKLHSGIAGKVPVLIVPNDEDFKTIINALSRKNEPDDIPNSMGAAIINGINNWDRINRLKKEWLASNPLGNWNHELKKNVIPNTALYKDKIIVLSKKPYSGVSSNSLHISSKNWIEYSVNIRLNHECAHLFTLHHYGKMANNMHDELIADYLGIISTLGKFDQQWFLKFLGLENYPEYRSGARLENYLGNPKLSNEAFDLLTTIIKKAAANIAAFDNHLNKIPRQEDLIYRLYSLCAVDLITMSSHSGFKYLLSHYLKVHVRCIKEGLEEISYEQ